MSLRLVKQQLSALSPVSEESTDQPGINKDSLRAIKKGNKAKKKQQKKGKSSAKKALSEEEIKRRNLEYYTKTATTSKATDAMTQALALLPISGGSSTQIKRH